VRTGYLKEYIVVIQKDQVLRGAGNSQKVVIINNVLPNNLNTISIAHVSGLALLQCYVEFYLKEYRACLFSRFGKRKFFNL